jgi:hypothetical protein
MLLTLLGLVMVNTAIPDHRNIINPGKSLGQFFNQGTVFFVMKPEDIAENVLPQVRVSVDYKGVCYHFTLFPQTPNGTPAFAAMDLLPPAFWRGWQIEVAKFFENYFGPDAQVGLDCIIRRENGQVVVSEGIVFSQSNG